MDVIEELLSISGDSDPELLVDLISMFLQDAPQKLEAITTGLAALDFEKVEHAAHSLKGSSGNLGAQRVQDLCETIQIAGRNKDRAKIEGAARSLLVDFEQARKALQELLKKYQ
jgi:HPt (histidine-containing phosphotransfer) domain-containing protein